MNGSRHRVALLSLMPVATVAVLAGCSARSGNTHSTGMHDSGNQSITHSVNDPSNSATHSAADPSVPAGGPDHQVAAVGSTANTPAPEFRSTVVYGLAKSVTPTQAGARLVWDKGDWQFNVGPKDPNTLGLRSCQTYDHGDVLTNCNPMLRTTDIPADVSIKLVFPGCPAGGPDIAGDPRHPDRALGNAPVDLTKFATLSHTACRPDYPAPAFGGLWLTFDDSGKLTDITEKFES